MLTAGTAVLVAIALRVLIGVLHELGHALVVVHHGRRLGPLRVGFFWGLLSCYVDATDALMLPRRRRLQQAAAGPLVDAGVGGIAAVCALLAPWGTTGLLVVVAGVCYLGVLTSSPSRRVPGPQRGSRR